MKKYTVPFTVTLGLLCICVVFSLDLRFPYFSFQPEPVTIHDTLVFHDTQLPYVSYDFKIKTTVFYNTPLWYYWSRNELCDSISAFNKRLMNKRFEGPSPDFWDHDGIAKEYLFPRERFSWKGIVDSSSYELEIKRKISFQKWEEEKNLTSP